MDLPAVRASDPRGRAPGGDGRGPCASRRPRARAEWHRHAHAFLRQRVRRRLLPRGQGLHRAGGDRRAGRKARNFRDDARGRCGAVRRVDRRWPAREQHAGRAGARAAPDRRAVRHDPQHRAGEERHEDRSRLRPVGTRHHPVRGRRGARAADARGGVLPDAAAHLVRGQPGAGGAQAGPARPAALTERSSTMKLMSGLLFFAALVTGGATLAAEVEGVRIDDKARVANADLALNGAGLRKRAFFKVYAMGLYVPQKSSNAAALLEQPGPKRVAIHMLRDVSADAFNEALADGIRANHSDADVKALEPRIKELGAIISQVGEAKKGMAIHLDWTGSETQVLVQGKPTGKPIAGQDFYRALLRVWLGDKPVQDDLKKSLLGG